jgi:peptide/nickel transport system substrate-binding protein
VWHSITRALLPCTLALACSALVPACRSRDDAATSFPRAETLYLGGLQWGEPTSFNPLLSSPDWPVPNGDQTFTLLYEPLFSYNSESGKMQPLLAESYEVRGDAIEVVLSSAAHWSDGKPVTGWDVKYTFDLGRTYRSLRVGPVWTYLRDVRLTDDDGAVAAAGKAAAPPYPRHIVFELEPARRNPLAVFDALQETAILPRHVIEPLLAEAHGDLAQFQQLKFDHDPVGSGPYRLLSYSSEKIVLSRDDGYWGNSALHGGKLPAPKYLIDLIYKGNDNYSIALQQGRLDASICYVPRIWLKQKKGVRSWYEKEPYFVSASLIMLVPNVTHRPLNDPALRRAMAYAINYKDIRELAVSGYSEPLKPGLILPFGLESKYYSEEDADSHGAHYDPDKARSILKAAGYTARYGADGELIETLDPHGSPVPTVYVKSPTGWSDWESIVGVVVRSLRDVGIDARERFVDASLYWHALPAGEFDMIMHQPAAAPTPSQPWGRFEAVLTSRDWAPDGEKMYKNIGRFNNPAAADYDARFDALLKTIPTMTDEAELRAAYRQLNALFMDAQATLPLVYRPDQFYEVSIRHWDNFPSAKNPYVPPQIPGDRLGTEALWALRPAGTQ